MFQEGDHYIKVAATTKKTPKVSLKTSMEFVFSRGDLVMFFFKRPQQDRDHEMGPNFWGEGKPT